jgi:RNA polymerase sigma-70 factor (ECF subfamily)
LSADRSSRRYVTVEEVYRRYGSDLLRFLHGANPHLNHQDCEDLLHQAVLKGVARLDQYDPERGSLRLWIFGILRNEMRQDLRHRKSAGASPAALPDLPDDEPSVETRAVTIERAMALDAAIHELPFREREALLMDLRTEGVATKEEVAARLGIAPASVAVYRQRARDHLREILTRTGVYEGGTTWRRDKKAIRTSWSRLS